jgi:hypothetical protein
LIGNIVSGPLQDIIFDGLTVGPFPDVSTFNDWFTQPNWAQNPSNRLLNDIDPLRRGLPDDPIRFVHGNLHQSNILIYAKASLKPMPRQPSQPEFTVAEGTTTQALRLEIGERHSTAGRAYGYRRHEDGFGVTDELILQHKKRRQRRRQHMGLKTYLQPLP